MKWFQRLIKAMLMAVVLLASALPTAAFAQIEPLEVNIDIKPCKEPNVLNVNQPSLLPVAIYGDYEINEISLTLQGVPVTEWKVKGGYLLAKFDAQAVIATLGQVNDGDIIKLTLEGETEYGTPIVGYDDVLILKRPR